jgi:hypothetical protein
MIDVFNSLVELADAEKIDSLTNDTDKQSLTKIIEENISINHLEKIYAHITEMIRFGEAKNGALLTANFILFVEISKMRFQHHTMIQVYDIITWCALLASISILFISFLPKLKKVKSFNPIYFGSVVTSCKEDFTSKMKNSSTAELHDYYCEQIHINSVIANRKFVQFRYALVFSVIAVIGFGISKIIS